ncbi:hypothetical protein [Methylobacterium longum]|uniref:Phosphoribulokinase n=1 Tax=Methylobacterium longum TaxID=767694 RepID=A0ABT8AVC6_9HYPH|nr:hypothetical protein [Methylobacterium longum]MDN3573831.1 hypothetical protein [Methylobacterium longum]GJE15111.1 Uridine kinase [Methylobacterium longum]
MTKNQLAIFSIGLLIKAIVCSLALYFSGNYLGLKWLNEPIFDFQLGQILRPIETESSNYAPGAVFFAPLVSIGSFILGEVPARVLVLANALLCDSLIYYILLRIVPVENRTATLSAYWFSPIMLWCLYRNGGLDYLYPVLPAAGFYFAKSQEYKKAAIFFGLAAAAMPLNVLLIPIFGLYFYGRGRRRHLTNQIMIICCITSLAASAAIAVQPALRILLYQGLTVAGPLSMSIKTSTQYEILLFPIFCFLLLFAAWRIQRLNFDLLLGLGTLAMTGFLVLLPWSLSLAVLAAPFLAAHAGKSLRSGMVLYVVFSFSVTILQILAALNFIDLVSVTPRVTASVAITTVLVSSTALFIQVARRSISRSYFFQATRRPIVVGIGGDSGAGKDTLASLITDLVGSSAVAHVSGDDYHLWDRHRPMWRALTHLDPRANDLARYESDVAKLVDRRYILAPHYDHSKGQMTKPFRVNPSEFVVASGLHALWSPSLNQIYDLKFFLDIDEDLRRFLKVRRDTSVRGHSVEAILASMDRRAEDRALYIEPQIQKADIILKLEPRVKGFLIRGYEASEPALRLIANIRSGVSVGELTQCLIAYCDIFALQNYNGSGDCELVVEGEPSAEDIGVAAANLAPELTDFLQGSPIWRPGLRGVMQLIVLTQIDRVRLERLGKS